MEHDTERVGRAPTDSKKRFEDAYRSYERALQESGVPVDAQMRVGEAFQTYVQLLHDLWQREDLQKPATDAYQAYVRALQDAFGSNGSKEHAGGAYRRYIRAVRDAWVDVDPDALDPTVLHAVCQSMTAVAWAATLVASDSAPAVPAPGVPELL